MLGTTLMKQALRRRRSLRSAGIPSVLAIALYGASTAEIAQQDITALIEASRQAAPRWMAAIEAAEHTSTHAPSLVMASAPRPTPQTAADYVVTSALPGQDQTVVRGLETFARESAPTVPPKRLAVNRSAKGDRHLTMAPDREMIEMAAGSVYSLPNLIAAGPEQDLPRVAFVRPLPATTETTVAAANPEGIDLRLAVARNVAATSMSLAAAYAPSELTNTRSPFEALLGKPGMDPAAAAEAALEANADRDPHWWMKRPLPASVVTSKEQRCLAEAVYFEARGESETGQIAVAQVVLNRVKNPAYPDTICKVVYQNRHLRNRCQFSFACDGIRDRVVPGKAWDLAQKVARETVAGHEFLEKVGASTHYHATYVKPRWARKMKRLEKIGRHIFYRTNNGGWS